MSSGLQTRTEVWIADLSLDCGIAKTARDINNVNLWVALMRQILKKKGKTLITEIIEYHMYDTLHNLHICFNISHK